MKKFMLCLLLPVAITLTIASCDHKEVCSAGTGGQVTLVVFPQHHGVGIPNRTGHLDTVYLKFNTQNNPSTDLNAYDKYIVGEAGENHVHLDSLTCGDYYIYATGYDTTGPYRVVGGIPYSFSQTSGEIDLNVPVTE